MMQDSTRLRAGKNLKRLIKERHYTQEQFAELIYADPTTVRKWLKYGINSIDTLDVIAKLFGISVMDILSK